MNENKTPYDANIEGQQAYINGKSLRSIPYAKLSEMGTSWMRGWHTAKFGAMLSGKL